MDTITTAEFADRFHVKPETIRHGYCVNGHYMGIKPLKLPNRRLLWPKAEALRLLDPEEPSGSVRADR